MSMVASGLSRIPARSRKPASISAAAAWWPRMAGISATTRHGSSGAQTGGAARAPPRMVRPKSDTQVPVRKRASSFANEPCLFIAPPSLHPCLGYLDDREGPGGGSSIKTGTGPKPCQYQSYFEHVVMSWHGNRGGGGGDPILPVVLEVLYCSGRGEIYMMRLPGIRPCLPAIPA